jgi:hypothetical protein
MARAAAQARISKKIASEKLNLSSYDSQQTRKKAA